MSPGYEKLKKVFEEAFLQAYEGKGKERHAAGRDFLDQPLLIIQELVGTGFALGQAIKKAQESQRMEYKAARTELLGALIYLAGAIAFMDIKEKRGQ